MTGNNRGEYTYSQSQRSNTDIQTHQDNSGSFKINSLSSNSTSMGVSSTKNRGAGIHS